MTCKNKACDVKVQAIKAGDYVQIYLDRADVGSGYRRHFVVSLGPVHATLFYVPTMVRFKIPRQDFDKYAKPVEFNRDVLLRMLRTNLGIARSAGARISENTTQWLIDKLEGQTESEAPLEAEAA